jgi:uncharacterized protein (DUF2147 family)
MAFRALLLAMAVTSGAGATLAAPPIEGSWEADDGDAHVEIHPCDQGVCGRITWYSDAIDEHGRARTDVNNPDRSKRDRAIVGLQILELNGPDKKGTYRGRVYDPKNGKTYRCNARLDDEGRLRLRGYVGVSLFGRTSRWSRLAPPE